MKKNIWALCSTILSLALSAAVCIPYSLSSVSNNEYTIKFAIIPAIIFGISIPCIIESFYKARKNSSFSILSTILPITAYISSSFVFMATIPFRNHTIGSGLEFISSDMRWVVVMLSFVIAAVVFFSIGIISSLNNLKDNSYFTLILRNIVLFIFFAATVYFCFTKTEVYKDLECPYNNPAAFYCSLIFASFSFVLYVVLYIINFSKSKKVQEVHLQDKQLKEEYTDDVLFAMFKFSKEKLTQRGYNLQDVKEVVLEKEEVVEKVTEKEAEEENKPLVIKEMKPLKEKKTIYPTIEELEKYIMENCPDSTISYNEKHDSFKAYKAKKLFLVVQSTNSDYRIIFQRKPISLSKLLVKYSGAIIKSKTPTGDQWFKLTNKGEFEETDLFNIIKFSYKYLLDEEEKEQIKREKEKQKLLEKKAKEKEKAKEAKQKALLKAKQEKDKARKKPSSSIASSSKEVIDNLDVNDLAQAAMQAAEAAAQAEKTKQ